MSAPAPTFSLLSAPADKAFDVSEAALSRWHDFRLTVHMLSDEEAAAKCSGWAREPVLERLRYLSARIVCGRSADGEAVLGPLALREIAGAWPAEAPGSSLSPFYRACLAAELLRGKLNGKDPQFSVGAETARAALRFLLAGADPRELNAPWPQLGGERLLPALFGALSTGRWALGTLAELGLDLSNLGHGPSAALLLIEEASKGSSGSAKTRDDVVVTPGDDDEDDEDNDEETEALIKNAQRARVSGEFGELIAASLASAPGAARAPLLDESPGQPPALLIALERAVQGKLPWGWVKTMLASGASVNARDAMGRGAAHIAFENEASEPARAEAISLLLGRSDFDWGAESVWGRAPSHSYRLRGAAGLGWWEACKNIEACWEGKAAAEAMELFADAWHPDSRDDFHALIDWLDQRFATFLAVRALGMAPPAEWVESALERGLGRWMAALPEERLAIFKGLVQERCSNAVELASPKPEPIPEPKDERPTLELYSAESWAEFAKEYLGSDSETHAFAKKLAKRVKTMGQEHRIRRLAMASHLLLKIDELRADFPHFSEVIDHLEDHCHLQMAGDGSFYLPPMLLAGGPGVGKTFFFKRVSEHVATAYKTLQMESMTGAFVITGMASSWSDSRPGVVYSALELGETANPIILLDEIDKASHESKHRPDTALLPLLEPHSAERFQDECVPLRMDARRVCWVATANDLSTVSAPLKTRMDVFRVRAPNARERRALCSGVYRSVLASGSWGQKMSPALSEAVLDMAAQTQGPGATRDLRRALTTACAKALRAGRSEIIPADLPAASRPTPTLWDAALPEPGASRAA